MERINDINVLSSSSKVCAEKYNSLLEMESKDLSKEIKCDVYIGVKPGTLEWIVTGPLTERKKANATAMMICLNEPCQELFLRAFIL